MTPTWHRFSLLPWSPGEDKLVAVILFPLANDALVLVSWWQLVNELCWGTFSVQALGKTASRLSFVGPLSLGQHGSLGATAGQLLQWHAGGQKPNQVLYMWMLQDTLFLSFLIHVSWWDAFATLFISRKDHPPSPPYCCSRTATWPRKF